MPALAARLIGPALALIAFGLYWWVGPDQRSTDAYLPLANAWLHGRADLDGSVYTWIELALYHGQWFVPFPPTATVVVLPFVVGLYAGLPTKLGRPSSDQLARARSIGLGMLGPALGMAAYNVIRFGSPLEFGYGLIMSRNGESVLSEPWYTHGILSPLYIPRGLFAMLGRQWDFVDDVPWLHPTWAGQAVTFTTPILGWLVRARVRDPLVAYALGSAG